MSVAYLSLGSNVDKERNLPACVRLLAARGRLLAVSPVYESAPVGSVDAAAFFNAAVAFETSLEPAELKEQVIRPIEEQLGRRRTSDPNAPRSIDVDISLFDNVVLQLGKRHIPDPDILRYPHVAQPLADIAPACRHPETGETLAEIAQRVLAASDQVLLRRDDFRLAP